MTDTRGVALATPEQLAYLTRLGSGFTQGRLTKEEAGVLISYHASKRGRRS